MADDKFARALADVPNLNVTTLAEGDVIEIETQNNVYTMIVIDPASGLVEAMSNGPHIRDPIEVRVRGSLIGASSLWMKRIAVGYQLELGVWTLTPAKTVSVNGVRILPSPELLH